ncbi:MAG: alanine--tRNA ligase [Planctomycetes bacterium]|nr:alanine--tRNA ligase [Planctomycetota bacterium]
MLTAKEIRTSFIDFFREKGHDFVPSSPIVPIGDNTLLFANAGMNQFKDIFMGLTVPKCKRAANSQKCLRVSGKHNDLEEVGKDTYHHTFFEMLGNWSFGDYFKAEAIEWAWQLLTEVWEIDPDKLWATVFQGSEKDGTPRDTEAKELWKKATSISADRVLACGKKDNFWEMGATGPCGPCSEIHIDLGPENCDMKNVAGHKCAVNCGCARFIELWNLVFIQFNRGENGTLNPLSAKHVDTGAGLERIVAVLQNKKSNYDTDLFMPVINHLSEMTGHRYTSTLGNKTDNAFRVIADHIRALTFAITDGAVPSNDGRGYVIRRILRRACRFGRELDMHEPFLYKVAPVVAEYMGEAFGEVRARIDYVSTVIESEEVSFNRTLDRGIDIFNAAAAKAKGETIDAEDAFQLYDTYGFPFDLTRLMAQERGLKVDSDKFNELMEQQRQRARAAQKTDSFMTALTDVELPTTEDLHKYKADSCESEILGFIDSDGFKTEGQIETGTETSIVLDKTCFYAESGGQVGDCGTIESASGKFIVEATSKIANCVLHQGKVGQGSLSVGDKAKAHISKDRNSIKKNHTATHLLQWALQQVCGEAIAQQGSLVSEDYLRFDFTCPRALTGEEAKKVETLIKEKIIADAPVTCKTMQRVDAEKLGAMALFGEKYGNDVRVVAIGAASEKGINEAFSKEFCGGTHVDSVGSIGNFKIIKEESISAGVRRITAMTGSGLGEYLEKRSDIVDELSVLLKVPVEELPMRVAAILKDNKKLAKQLKTAAKQSGVDIMAEARKLLDSCEKVGNSSVITSKLPATSVEQARAAIDMLKKKAKSAAVVFGFADDEGKVTLISGVTDDLIKKGLKAGDLIKEIAPIVGGGGGGRPQMAQAGGKDPAKIDEALKKAVELIKEKLAG